MQDNNNIAEERYCPRVDSWLATWSAAPYRPLPPADDHCAECGTLVIYNPTPGEGPVRLVCLDCLHASQT